MVAFWWLSTENACWEPRNGYGSIQNYHHIWKDGLGSSGYGYMASQWSRMEPQQTDFLYGTCSAKSNCHFASLLGNWILRGKGTVSSALLFPRYQPAPSSFSLNFCDVIELANFFPFLRGGSHTTALCTPEGPLSQLLRAEARLLCTGDQPRFSYLCKPLMRQSWEMWHAGGGRMTCPGPDSPASKSQPGVSHLFGDKKKSSWSLGWSGCPQANVYDWEDHVEHVCIWFSAVVWQNTIALYEALI